MPKSTREPVVARTAIVAAATAVLHVLVVLGVFPIDTGAEQAIAGALDLVGVAVAAVWSRAAVTPKADPRDDAGRPLTPEPAFDEAAAEAALQAAGGPNA